MDEKTRKFLIKYMKKTGRLRTLEVLKRRSPENRNSDGRKKPLTSLSFQILKAPERKESNFEIKKKKKRTKSDSEIGLEEIEKFVAAFDAKYASISHTPNTMADQIATLWPCMATLPRPYVYRCLLLMC